MSFNVSPGDLVRARGREWVALPAPDSNVLALRPLSGNENDIVLLNPELELTAVEPARFDLPTDAVPTVQSKAALLSDALRLTLRRGTGPFRSAAHLAFEPRTYQLVPLLMALRLQVPRLLIADDVGIAEDEASLHVSDILFTKLSDGDGVPFLLSFGRRIFSLRNLPKQGLRFPPCSLRRPNAV